MTAGTYKLYCGMAPLRMLCRMGAVHCSQNGAKSIILCAAGSHSKRSSNSSCSLRWPAVLLIVPVQLLCPFVWCLRMLPLLLLSAFTLIVPSLDFPSVRAASSNGLAAQTQSQCILYTHTHTHTRESILNEVCGLNPGKVAVDVDLCVSLCTCALQRNGDGEKMLSQCSDASALCADAEELWMWRALSQSLQGQGTETQHLSALINDTHVSIQQAQQYIMYNAHTHTHTHTDTHILSNYTAHISHAAVLFGGVPVCACGGYAVIMGWSPL